MFFLCASLRSCDLGSPKLAHMTLSLILMLDLNFNFLGLPFARYEQVNPHLPKLAIKNKATAR